MGIYQSESNSNSDSDSSVHTYANSYSDTDTHADTHTNAYADSYAGTDSFAGLASARLKRLCDGVNPGGDDKSHGRAGQSTGDGYPAGALRFL